VRKALEAGREPPSITIPASNQNLDLRFIAGPLLVTASKFSVKRGPKGAAKGENSQILVYAQECQKVTSLGL